MPRAVRIREVGPRDGFQNEPEVIPTERKVELIDALARTGLRRIEVTSFVRAERIPQLADAEQVLELMDVPREVAVSVLIPNERGLERALEHRERFAEVNVFLSASETHNERNVNRSVADSLSALERVLARAREAGLACEGVISTAFGCPYEGHVPPARVLEIAARLRDAGAGEVALADTTGMANPLQVRELFAARAGRAGTANGAHGALPQHARAGARERARGARGRRGLLRGELRRARRLSGSSGGHGQHRDGGPGLDAPGDGHRDRCGPARADRLLAARAGDPGQAAGESHNRRGTGRMGGRPRRRCLTAVRITSIAIDTRRGRA